MNEKDRSFITRLFAVVVAFLVVFMVVSLVGGLIAARLLDIKVDADRVFGIIGPSFQMILACILAALVVRPAASPTDKEPPK